MIQFLLTTYGLEEFGVRINVKMATAGDYFRAVELAEREG